MTNYVALFALVGWLFAFAGKPAMNAQNCPPPENFQVNIVQGSPSWAELQWNAPSGGSVDGYLLVVVQNGIQTTVILPTSPTNYIYTIPSGTNELEFQLSSICPGGHYSTPFIWKRTFVIIEDLVLLRNSTTQEEQICTNPCPGATHFTYRDPRLGWTQPQPGSSISLYNINTFCGCMSQSFLSFDDQETVDYCKRLAQEAFTANENLIFQLCSSTRERSMKTTSASLLSTPNPFDQYIQLNVPQGFAEAANIRLSDAWGRILIEQGWEPDAGYSVLVNTAHLPAGLYYIQVSTKDELVWANKLFKP